jgi:hypothetical protein
MQIENPRRTETLLASLVHDFLPMTSPLPKWMSSRTAPDYGEVPLARWHLSDYGRRGDSEESYVTAERRAGIFGMKSLLDQLPAIVAEGKREAERTLERAQGSFRLGLQTRELVIPSRDSNWLDLLKTAEKREQLTSGAPPSQLIYGDNLLAMASMITAGEGSLLSKIDMIYIDPPFDSKADYRTKISIANSELEQAPSVMDRWHSIVPGYDYASSVPYPGTSFGFWQSIHSY